MTTNETGNTNYLLTPGPLTTSLSIKQAMLRDWGSRDADFIALTARIRERLLAVANASDSHVCVPVQGSGTFAVEAALGTVVPWDGKVLVLINGAYGQRMARILGIVGREVVTIENAENEVSDTAALDAMLARDTAISHVAAVHCETTSGILNPIQEIADIVARHGRSLLIDSMSAFGAIDVDASKVRFDVLMASSNKCFEGVPGMGFALIRRSVLEGCEGNAHSLSLDLYDQWQALEKNGQWRFTPPTHVLAAFDRALSEHADEGGVAGRHARYAGNCGILVDGMRAMGFETLLPDDVQAPIIITFHTPSDPKFDFQVFYDSLSDRGFVIYPGKLTVADSFRMGCIGRLGEDQMHAALDAVRATLSEMGVTQCGRARAA